MAAVVDLRVHGRKAGYGNLFLSPQHMLFYEADAPGARFRFIIHGCMAPAHRYQTADKTSFEFLCQALPFSLVFLQKFSCLCLTPPT